MLCLQYATFLGGSYDCFGFWSYTILPFPPLVHPFFSFLFGPGIDFQIFNRVLCWQVATFIVQKILLDDVGLDYICTTAERFFAVGRVLGSMVSTLAEQPSSRLLKHIIRCYLRLSDNPRLIEIYCDVG